MKFLILITSLLLTANLSLFGQSKSATEEWIKEKIQMNGYSDDIEIFHNYKIDFKEGNLIIIANLKSIFKGRETIIAPQYIIPIRELGEIRFEEKLNNIWLFIKLKSGENRICCKNDLDNSITYVDNVTLLLEKSILKENLPTRMMKAFENLIKLNGGKVIGNTF